MISFFSRRAIAFSLFAACLLDVRVASAAEVPLLERAGERVEAFWDQLSSVASTENVLQEKLDPKGRVVLNNRAKYDYLITLRWDNGGMLVDESRLPVGEKQRKSPQGTLLTTQGFATMLMVFHPRFQSSYAFSQETKLEDRLVRIDFSARNGAASPAVLSLKGRDFPIGWEGTAWIDPKLAIVTRIEAHWKQPPEEIGVQSLSSEVNYAPTSFKGSPETIWLPVTARVEVRTQHQHWRNRHEFSGYRLFSVDADSDVRGGAGKANGKSQ